MRRKHQRNMKEPHRYGSDIGKDIEQEHKAFNTSCISEMSLRDTTKIGEPPPGTQKTCKSGNTLINPPTFLNNMFNAPRNNADYLEIGQSHEDIEIYKHS